MVLQYLVSIDKVFLYIVCMCHHSDYHRNCSIIRCDAMREHFKAYIYIYIQHPLK